MVFHRLPRLHSRLFFVLEPCLLGLLVRQRAQRLPLALADLADAQPGLLQKLHALERGAGGLAQLAQLGEVDRHGELAAELDVDEAPARLLARGLGVVVRRAGAACALCGRGG